MLEGVDSAIRPSVPHLRLAQSSDQQIAAQLNHYRHSQPIATSSNLKANQLGNFHQVLYILRVEINNRPGAASEDPGNIAHMWQGCGWGEGERCWARAAASTCPREVSPLRCSLRRRCQ